MTTLPTLLAELDAMKLNTRLHAIWFLQHGELHPEIHFVIRDRLESSIRRVQQAGPEARAALLAEIPAEGTA
jgi:hypothetical protein